MGVMNADPSLATRHSRVRELTLAMSTALCYGIALGLFPALLSLNLETNGFETSWSGLLGAMPAIAGMAIVPFSPRMVARIGARPVYFASATLSIATAALFPMFPNLAAWFVLRFLMGAGLAVQFVVGESWVNSLAEGPNRGRILGIYVIVLGAGLFVGPLIMTITGTRGHPPFLVAAGLLLLGCLPILLARQMLSCSEDSSRIMGFIDALLRKPSAMITGFFDGFIFQTLLIFLPIYALRLGTSEERAIQYLAVCMLGGIPLQLVVGYLLDRIGSEAVLVLACAVIVPALPAFAWLIDQPAAAWPTLILIGAASAAVYTAGIAAISGSFNAQEMPSGTATFNVLWCIGAVIGPAVAGYAMTVWDPHGVALSMIVSCVVLGFANALARHREGRVSSSR
jgi:MFS family permease